MKSYYLGLSALCVAALASSCIDDDYDLANIDSNVRVEVKDLTVPVNIDKVTLKSIFSLGEDSKVKEINGVYAVVESGEFHSSPVHISGFTIHGSSIPSTAIDIPYVSIPAVGDLAAEIHIEPEERDFNYTGYNVPKEVIDFDSAMGQVGVDIRLTLSGIEQVASAFEIKGLQLQLPKGLRITSIEGGSYDPATGVASIPDRRVVGSSTSFHIVADKIDLDQLGAVFDYAAHTITAAGKVHVKSMTLALKTGDILAEGITTTFHLGIDYTMPSIAINSVSGTLEYDIEDMNIDPISLSDLPDVISQSGTDIRIANPQIYINLNNPVQQYSVSAQTGITLTGVHRDGSRKRCTLDDGFFTIGTGNPSGMYTYCISPTRPDAFYQGYEGAEHVKFTSLSDVLSGNDIPSTIEVELNDPKMPRQRVTDFALGTDIASVRGNYTFYAPLALNPGSKITYTDQVDGWSSEDLDALTITKLTVTALVTTDAPVNLNFTGYPIDKNGNQINNVTIEGASVSANAQGQALTLTITGEIRHLDGIRFVAVATAQSAETLRPDIKIEVSKVRPVACGYYEKEL
ncbi:MAG: hypothetical protein ACI4AM_07920 [Muribaculaceae bacterium]